MNRVLSYIKLMNKRTLSALVSAVLFQTVFVGYCFYQLFSHNYSLIAVSLGLLLTPFLFAYTMSKISILNKKKSTKRIFNYMNYIVDKSVQ